LLRLPEQRILPELQGYQLISQVAQVALGCATRQHDSSRERDGQRAHRAFNTEVLPAGRADANHSLPVVMRSPPRVIMNSARRLRAYAASVVPGSSGWSSPIVSVVNRPASRPKPTR